MEQREGDAPRAGDGPRTASPFSCLPGELLQHILGLVLHPPAPGCPEDDTPAFYRSVPLVCRRWRQLSLAPALLHSLGCTFDVQEGEPIIVRIRSFVHWLLRHAVSHVRQLGLYVDGDLEMFDPEGDGWHELLALALGGCAAGGKLESLDLEMFNAPGIHGEHWLPSLPGLTRLRLVCTGGDFNDVRLPASLKFMSGLQDLEIVAQRGLRCPQLPASLTCLSLGLGVKLPRQMRRLSRLRCVKLETSRIPADGYGVLTTAPALRDLTLEYGGSVPDCLPQLTSLRALTIKRTLENAGDDGGAQLAAALGQLTRLTRLVLEQQEALTALPHELDGLPQLRWLVFGRSAVPHGKLAAALEDAAWLPGLEHLSIPVTALAACSPVLAEATQLRVLELTGCSGKQTTLEAMGAAEELPQLRCLRLLSRWSRWRGRLPPQAVQAAEAARRRKPCLWIEFADRPLRPS